MFPPRNELRFQLVWRIRHASQSVTVPLAEHLRHLHGTGSLERKQELH